MPYQKRKRKKKDVVFDAIPVSCPRCGWRLLDADPHTVIQVQQLQLGIGVPDNQWQPDYYIKCKNCKAHIAFRTADTPNENTVQSTTQKPQRGRY